MHFTGNTGSSTNGSARPSTRWVRTRATKTVVCVCATSYFTGGGGDGNGGGGGSSVVAYGFDIGWTRAECARVWSLRAHMLVRMRVGRVVSPVVAAVLLALCKTLQLAWARWRARICRETAYAYNTYVSVRADVEMQRDYMGCSCVLVMWARARMLFWTDVAARKRNVCVGRLLTNCICGPETADIAWRTATSISQRPLPRQPAAQSSDWRVEWMPSEFGFCWCLCCDEFQLDTNVSRFTADRNIEALGLFVGLTSRLYPQHYQVMWSNRN